MNKNDRIPNSYLICIAGLRDKFTELVDCQFLIRAPSPYLNTISDPDPPIRPFPQLTMTEAYMYQVPDINFKVMLQCKKCKKTADFSNVNK